MFLRKIYPYIFYKLYKFSEAAPSKWWSDWKAAIVMLALELWVIISAFVYYGTITKGELPDDYIILLVGAIIIGILILIKYLVFYRNERWRDYVEEFDKLSKKKNRIGSIIVSSIVLLIISNLIFSFYLMSQVNWK